MNPNRKKLLIPISILILIFTIFVFFVVNIKYKEVTELRMVKTDIESSIMVSKLIHEIQIERGLSFGYLVSKGRIFNEKLQKQRLKTKVIINSFKKQVEVEEYNEIINNITKILDTIDMVRVKVDRLDEKPRDVLEYYSKIVNSLLQGVYQLTKKIDGLELREKVISYLNFLQLKEGIAIERAIGTMIILNNITNLDLKLQYYKQIVKQEEYENSFLDIASPNIKKYYIEHIDAKCIQDIKDIENKILRSSKYKPLNIDVSIWFSSISEKIDILKDVEDYITNNILKFVIKKINQNSINTTIFLLLIIFSIILFIYTIYSIVHILKAEVKLKNIIDKYIISSTTNHKGKIISVSSAFCKISGYDKKELIGKPHNIIRHQDTSKELFEQMWQKIQNGEQFTADIKNHKKDGGYYWVNTNIEPVFDNKGLVKSYIAIKHDITDKIDLEDAIEKNRIKDKQLMHQSRLAQMGEMISMIAHEWRQPLAAISSTSSGIYLKAQLGKLDKETAMELSKNITKFSQHLSTTIDDFRDFFKTNKEKKETTYIEIIDSVLGIVEISILNKNIKLEKNINSDYKFYTYPSELKQVVLNLIKNSEDILIENKIEDPIITIEAKDNILTVRDNGGGVPLDIIDNIFDPYFSTKLKKDGTGLGLYMSKIIIEEHCNGKLDVYNDENGAVFIIELNL